MLRPRVLASLSISLAVSLVACASILGDFEIAPDTGDGGPNDTGSRDGNVLADTGPTNEGGPGDGGPDLGAQPVPVDVAVNAVASCARLRYGLNDVRTFCWGAATPLTNAYLGVPDGAPGADPFVRPRLAGDRDPIRFNAIVGTGSGSWFVASMDDIGRSSTISWGRNDSAQTGQGDAGAPVLPARLLRADAGGIAGSTAAGGERHGCVIDTDKLYCWGQNESCQANGAVLVPPEESCPSSRPNPITTPTEPVGLFVGSVTYEKVAAGGAHTCFIARDPLSPAAAAHAVYCFGNNERRQCGPNGPSTFGTAHKITQTAREDVTRMEVAAGDNHSCAIVDRNALICWGDNRLKQVDPDQPENELPPHPIALGEGADGNLRNLRLAGNTTCFVSHVGIESHIYCFGGFAGAGSAFTPPFGREPTATLGAVSDLTNITDFSLSSLHACAIGTVGAEPPGVYCWGSNAQRAVDPTTAGGNVVKPRRVRFPAR